MQSPNDGDILKPSPRKHALTVVPPDAADARTPAGPFTKHTKTPTIAAIRRSLAEWPDFLQQEGQSLCLVTLQSAAHTTPPSELGRAELRRLYRWLKRQVASKAADFDDELPVLSGMLTDSKVEWPDEPGCRALLGVPLGDMSVAVVTNTLASHQSTTGLMVTCRC